MKILIAHNAYQHSGGEDAVVDAEIALLQNYGHEVHVYRRHNDELKTMPKAAAALSAVWSHGAANQMKDLCETFRPDVIHVHNTFPLISPSFTWMAARSNIPVVQTLHNFRLLCPQAMFLRNGKVCEDCLGKVPWRAVTRKCYRDSGVQSAVAATVLTAHQAIGTYRNKITCYIALNEFCRAKFIEGGLPADRIFLKPHFVVSHAIPDREDRRGGLFIGRLSAEKGLDVLIDAVKQLKNLSIRIVGTGPLESRVQQEFKQNHIGLKSRDEVLALLRKSLFLVAPSTCYETFGLTVVEAFASGTAVIASRHGAYSEIVNDGITGLLFTPGDANDLAAKIAWAESHPEQMLAMGRAARMEYEARYTPQRNYKLLIGIYENALGATRKEYQIA